MAETTERLKEIEERAGKAAQDTDAALAQAQERKG
jgi:hypothetical protein